MVTAGGDSDTPEAVRDAILAQAKVLSGQGVAEDQLLRLKRSLLGRRIRDLDSFDSTCFRICAYHFSEFDYMDFPVVVESITAAEILEFISRAITPDNCCLSVVYPLDKEAEA